MKLKLAAFIATHVHVLCEPTWRREYSKPCCSNVVEPQSLENNVVMKFRVQAKDLGDYPEIRDLARFAALKPEAPDFQAISQERLTGTMSLPRLGGALNQNTSQGASQLYSRTSRNSYKACRQRNTRFQCRAQSTKPELNGIRRDVERFFEVQI